MLRTARPVCCIGIRTASTVVSARAFCVSIRSVDVDAYATSPLTSARVVAPPVNNLRNCTYGGITLGNRSSQRCYSSEGKPSAAAATSPAAGTNVKSTQALNSAKEGQAPKDFRSAKYKGSRPTGSSPTQSDFSRLDIRVGRIAEVNKHPTADNLYLSKIDIGDGDGKLRSIVSGLVKHIPIEKMRERFVIVLANLQARNFQGSPSEGMLLVAADATKSTLELLEPASGTPVGERVLVKGEETAPEKPHAHKKVLERVMPELKTNDEAMATYKGSPLTTTKGVVKAPSLKNASIS